MWKTTFDKTFEDFMNNKLTSNDLGYFETDDDYIFTLTVPFFDKDDLRVKVEKNVLIVDGYANVYGKERFLKRKWFVDEYINIDTLRVTHKNGVLFFTFSKVKNEPVARNIEIQ